MLIHAKSRVSENVVHDREEAMVSKFLQDLYQIINIEFLRNFCSTVKKTNYFQVSPQHRRPCFWSPKTHLGGLTLKVPS